jgi:hypothetical protein
MNDPSALKGRHDAPLATTELIRWSDSKDEPGEEETADVETADPVETNPTDAAESAAPVVTALG